MSRTLMMLCLSLVLGACARQPTPVSHQSTVVQWDSTAAREVRTQVEETMGAFASMNVDSFKAGLAEDVVGFEVDLDGKPVRLGSEAVRFAQDTFAQLKKIGASAKLDIHANNCQATSTVAYSTVEFDFRATTADGSTMSQPTRNTVILRKGEDGWKWTHWHSSPAAAIPSAQAAKPK